MGILSGNPKNEPMHYGEVFGVWSYLSGLKSAVAGYQTFMNHVGDGDLRGFIEDNIKNVIKPEMEQLEDLLKANGIGLPPGPPEKPQASLESIPAGARFSDPEISAVLSKNMAEGLVACSTIIGQSVREDIGMMFTQFHATKVQYAGRLLRLNKDKGWLIPPPLHVKTPEPALV
jgi:hypothetical protein